MKSDEGKTPEPIPRSPVKEKSAPARIRSRVLEQSILFVSIVKWLFFAACVGAIVGLAGAANTPISASIMAVELFGPAVAPYAAMACVISFLMTGHRSVYPSQVLAASKSRSLIVSKGREIYVCDVNFKPRDKSVAGGIIKGFSEIGAKSPQRRKE